MLPSLRLALLIAGLAPLLVSATGREFTVLTFNVENLFDADQVALYDDYKEVDTNRAHPYTPAMLARKVEMVGRVLAASVPGGPDIIVFSEFEEDRTPESSVVDLEAAIVAEQDWSVAELLAPPHLERMRGYPVEFFVLKQLRDIGLGAYHVAQATWPNGDLTLASVHKNVIFSRFPIRSVRWHPLEGARAIVEADLDINGESFVVFAHHWKSGASNPEMELVRQGNARVQRARLDELLATNPRRDILLAGDFNTAYEQRMLLPEFSPNAVNDILGSQGDERKVANGEAVLYNLWFDLAPGRRASDSFRGYWGTLMQKMITPGLYDHRGIQYVRGSMKVIAIPGLTVNPVAWTPKRWKFFGGGQGGSDHLPLLARFRVIPAAAASDEIIAMTDARSQQSAELAPVPVDYERLITENFPAAATALANLTDEQLGAALGGFYHVVGKLTQNRRFKVEVAGREFEVWSYDPEVMEKMQTWRVGRRVRFAAELDEFRGNLQFVIPRTDWVNVPARSGD